MVCENISINCTEPILSCPHHSAEFYGYLYFHTPIALAGIVMNIFNIAILSGTAFKGCGPTFTFLLAKAVSDLLFLILACPIGVTRCAKQQQGWQLYSRQIYDIYIYTPIGHSFATLSVWLTAIVAIERYITVAQGTMARRICTKDVAQWTVIILILPAFLINFPYFFYRCVNENEHARIYTYLGNSRGFKVYSWVRMMIIKYIPIVIVIVFNMLLLAFICKSTRGHDVFSQNPNHSRIKLQSRCSIMLFAITMSFIFCHFLEPFIHMEIYSSLFGECSIYRMTFRDFRMVIKVLECASYAASGFVFYCIFNKEFASRMNKMLSLNKPCRKVKLNNYNQNKVKPSSTQVVTTKTYATGAATEPGVMNQPDTSTKEGRTAIKKQSLQIKKVELISVGCESCTCERRVTFADNVKK